MAKFKGVELVCCICGSSFKVPQCRAKKAVTCSHKCSVVYRAAELSKPKVEFKCPECGKTFFEHESRAGWRKYCSNKCRNSSPQYRALMSKVNIGAGNAMWAGGTTLRQDGYMYENCRDHPLSNSGYVLQHRLVVERHLIQTNPTSECLVIIDRHLCLDPKLVVHHVNFDRKDNRLENLKIMSVGDHQRLHNLARKKGALL